MTAQKSYERINYLIRPNKNIERKLIFESLLRVGQIVDLSDHRYIGFGSMWFADFVIAHRLLDLKEMWSIEKKDAARAEFNRPYKMIEVHPGTCGEVLSKISSKNWRKPCIAWLDYDGPLDAEVRSDLEMLVLKAAPYSVIMATVNSSWLTYRPLVPGAAQRGLARSTIEDILGPAAVADGFSKERPDKTLEVGKKDFAEFLATSLTNFLIHKTTVAGRECAGELMSFLPLFSFCHIDGAEMVTIGGILCSNSSGGAILKAMIGDPMGKPRHKQLDLIQLTIKEKLLLDRILPAIDAPTYLSEAKSNGLKLPEREIAKYRECYRHFPVFTETTF